MFVALPMNEQTDNNAEGTLIVIFSIGSGSAQPIDVKNVFTFFIIVTFFYVFNVFLFSVRFFLKQKTFKNCFLCKLIVRFNFSYATFLNSKLLKLCKFNKMIGLTAAVYCCFQLSLCLADGPII